MQSATGGRQPPMWLPPLQVDWLVALVLVIVGSNIEIIPEEYHAKVSNPLVFLFGMLFVAGIASTGEYPIAFAIAFCLVNLIRIMPKPAPKPLRTSPGTEGFVPSGTMDWVTTQKKWFVEKVLHEKPVAIREKEVSTYPIQA